MIKLRIVDGYYDEEEGFNVASFDTTGTSINEEYYETAGLCLNYGKGWYRHCKIWVVKQSTLRGTLLVCAHEIAHALIWILRLPDKRNAWVDGER